MSSRRRSVSTQGFKSASIWVYRRRSGSTTSRVPASTGAWTRRIRSPLTPWRRQSSGPSWWPTGATPQSPTSRTGSSWSSLGPCAPSRPSLLSFPLLVPRWPRPVESRNLGHNEVGVKVDCGGLTRVALGLVCITYDSSIKPHGIRFHILLGSGSLWKDSKNLLHDYGLLAQLNPNSTWIENVGLISESSWLRMGNFAAWIRLGLVIS